MKEDLFHLGIKAVITRDNKILLLKVNPNELKGKLNNEYWDLPGGRVKKGSTPEGTLLREIEEETGLKEIKKLEHIGMVLSTILIPISDSEDVGLILSIYRCSIEKINELKLSDEHTEYNWFANDEASKLLEIKYPLDFCLKIKSL